MKAILIDNRLEFSQNLKSFNGNVGLNGATDQQWYDWGFREYVVPDYTTLQKLGDIYFDTHLDILTHYVIDKTQAEIDQDILDQEATTII